VDFSESFWELKKLRKQSIDSKQGSSNEIIDDPELIKEVYNVIQNSKRVYKKMIDKGVAKEQARIILPLCLNTTFIWTGSVLAFLHLFELRLKNDAQEETRNLVYDILDQVKQLNVFKNTLEVWGY
jgi:thymidylate synthase (FAD)